MERFDLRPGMHVHLVGIGGAGLSAIARVLLGRGFVVSGSDRQVSPTTADLQTAGARVFHGHHAAHVAGADLLLISSAVALDNPEVTAARAAGVPVVKRVDFLGALAAGADAIAVAGTHGKTTTTGMVAQILLSAGLDPTVIVGGVLPELGGNGRAGQGRHFVVEADEYDRTFLGLRPQVAVVTNVEHDHPDLYPTPADYRQAFCDFAGRVPDGGLLVYCADDAGAFSVAQTVSRPQLQVIAYGLGPAEWRAVDLRINQLGGTDFLVQRLQKVVGLARLRVPGEHNVRNALAATVVAAHLGVEFETIRRALGDFGGVGRRFQEAGEVGDVIVVDDYAHHPTEIRATLAAARQRFPGRRLWAVWQPHTFSRTKLLLADFAASFDQADRVVVLDIFGSRENDTLGLEAAALVAEIRHPQAHYVGELAPAAAFILDRVRPGDVVLTLAAGNGNLVGEWVLDGLRQRLSLGSGRMPAMSAGRKNEP